MTIEEKRKQMTALIDNIKKHSDRLKDNQTLPLLELSVILSKITQLHETTLILKYISAVEQHYEEEEFGVSPTMSDESIEEIVQINQSADEPELKEKEEEPVESMVEATLEPEIEKEDQVEEREIPNELVKSNEEDHNIEEEKSAKDSLNYSHESTEKEQPNEAMPEVEQEVPEIDMPEKEEVTEVEETPEIFIESNEEENKNIEVESFDEPSITLQEAEERQDLSSKPDLNEAFSEAEDSSLSVHLGKQPIGDLLSAIALNERYLYANELFDGDMESFRKSIGIINDLESGEEAKKFLDTELKGNYGWEEDNEMVRALYTLVERRFL